MNVFNKNFWRLSPCKIEVSVEHWKANGGFFGRGKAGRFPIVLLPGHFSVNADCYMFHCLPQVSEAWRRCRQNKGLCGLTLHDDNTSTPCHHWNAADPLFSRLLLLRLVPIPTPQWGAANAEIKVPSDENTELEGSLLKAWSRSIYCHAMLHLLPWISSLLISTLPVHSPAFFQNFSGVIPVLAVTNTSSRVGLQNKKGHP